MTIQKGPSGALGTTIEAGEIGSGAVTTAKLATDLVVTHALGSASTPSITFTGDTNTGIFSPTADTIAFAEGGVESMRIDSSGNLGIGTSSPAQKLDVVTSGGPSVIRNTSYRAEAGQAALGLRFARGTVSSPTIVLNGDTIGVIDFYPYNGTNFNLQTAQIQAKVNGTVTSSSIPTDIVFGTDAAGEAYATNRERMRINQFGVGIGGAVPSSGTGITFPATQSASSNANTLDDYEEGTWTPTTPVGISVSTAWYQKIGNSVFINAFINVNSNSNTSSFIITGLPFGLLSGSSSVGCFNNKNEDLYAYMDGTGIFIRTSGNNSRQCNELSGNFVAFQMSYLTT
jgi:hypothetical protein